MLHRLAPSLVARGSSEASLQSVADVLGQNVALVRVQAHDHGLEGLEVGNSWAVRARKELLSVALETFLKHGDDLVPEVGEPLVSSRWVKGLLAEKRGENVVVRTLLVLHEVDE